MKICVCGYPGKAGESEPRVFYLGVRRLPVIAILDRWQDTSHRFFPVKADDGRCIVLLHSPPSHQWELAAVYSAPRRRVPEPIGAVPSTN